MAACPVTALSRNARQGTVASLATPPARCSQAPGRVTVSLSHWTLTTAVQAAQGLRPNCLSQVQSALRRATGPWPRLSVHLNSQSGGAGSPTVEFQLRLVLQVCARLRTDSASRRRPLPGAPQVQSGAARPRSGAGLSDAMIKPTPHGDAAAPMPRRAGEWPGSLSPPA
jgi:hypothetical protein